MIKYLLLNPHTYDLLSSLIFRINCHGSFKFFTNPPNLTTHLMVSSFKIIKRKQLDPLNPTIPLTNSLFFEI
jgi:hypothetical protein